VSARKQKKRVREAQSDEEASYTMRGQESEATEMEQSSGRMVNLDVSSNKGRFQVCICDW